MRGLRGVDLFAGAGGFALGMQEAGITIVRSIDCEPTVLEIHKVNVRNTKRLVVAPPPIEPPAIGAPFRRGQIARSYRKEHVADLSAIVSVAPEIALDRPDVIFGGPPCQAFSSAGQRRGDNDFRSSHIEGFAIIVAAARPRYFVMENVPGVRRTEAYQRALAILRLAGFGLTETVVDAAFFGVPQARRRMIVAGCLDETDGWLNAYLAQYRSDRPMTVANIFGEDFGTHYASFALEQDAADAIPEKDLGQYNGVRIGKADLSRLEGRRLDTRYYYCTAGGPTSASLHRTDRPAPTLIRTSMDALPQTYRPAAGDRIDLRRVTQLTFEQYSELAGYPKGWDWGLDSEGELSVGVRNRQQMLANSVPPPLARCIGRAIVNHYERKVPLATAERAWNPSDRDVKRYTSWLKVVKNLDGKTLSQELANLKSAKRLVIDRDLPKATEEIRALDLLPATSPRHMAASRKSQLKRSLLNLAEFEFYQSCVRAGLFPDDDERYARGELQQMLDPALEADILEQTLQEYDRPIALSFNSAAE